MVRRVSPDELAGLDLSGWRVAIIGAEPVRSNVVDAFVDVLAPLGFRRRAFCPAYGLAESTLVVTATPPDQDAPTLGEGRYEPRRAPEVLVSSGRPVWGATVTTRHADGTVLPEGEVGEIWVSGPSLADGYEAVEGEDPFASGWLRTGDVGTIQEGELYVFRRMADSFRVRGKRVFAERAEQQIQGIVGRDVAFVVVPSRSAGAGPTVIVESSIPWDDAKVAEASAAITEQFDGAGVDFVFVPRGGIPRTTSGKPKRKECWHRYVGQPEGS